ncbi:MAG: hypothetical protein BWY75_03620 [bacterium ADurb.Bin425]|nr:MAG: hypothetical protein BWY75_03620 [bacterium ADurb.Bin425]
MTTAQTGATLTSDRVDFIDKDYTRSLFLSLLEEVAHTRRTYADKHLDKV